MVEQELQHCNNLADGSWKIWENWKTIMFHCLGNWRVSREGISTRQPLLWDSESKATKPREAKAQNFTPAILLSSPNLSNAYIKASLGCAHAIIVFLWSFWREQRGYEHKYKADKWKHYFKYIWYGSSTQEEHTLDLEGHEVGHVLWLWVSYYTHRYFNSISISRFCWPACLFCCPRFPAVFILFPPTFRIWFKLARMKVYGSLSGASRMLNKADAGLLLALRVRLHRRRQQQHFVKSYDTKHIK